MEETKRRSLAPLIVALVLLVLPLLYVSSYFALVVPAGQWVSDPNGNVRGTARRREVTLQYRGRVKRYRLDEARCQAVFWPLEQLDRRFRPETWNNDPDPPEVERLFLED